MALRKQILLFFVAAACMAAATGMHESFFNNFLSDRFQIDAEVRGVLEFPRELPGFLVVVTAGVLAGISVTRVAAVGAGVFVAGMFGMVLLGDVYWRMVAMMVLGSVGMHLLQPIRTTIAIGLSRPENRGKRLGQLGMVSTVAQIGGCGAIWLLFHFSGAPYRVAFAMAGALAVVSLVVYARMHVPHLVERRARFLMRRRYSLYYVLECLFGARKQIFITFGAWVLIKVYGEPTKTIAMLWIVASAVGVVAKPMAGAAIDRFGERVVLVADGVMLAVVCVGYGYAFLMTGDMAAARWIVYGCFVADNVLFSLGAARSVYVSRLAHSPVEISSTLSVGITLNHAVSMVVPVLAGWAWVRFGYERVFLAAAMFALCIAAVASLVPKRDHLREIEAETTRRREEGAKGSAKT